MKSPSRNWGLATTRSIRGGPGARVSKGAARRSKLLRRRRSIRVGAVSIRGPASSSRRRPWDDTATVTTPAPSSSWAVLRWGIAPGGASSTATEASSASRVRTISQFSWKPAREGPRIMSSASMTNRAVSPRRRADNPPGQPLKGQRWRRSFAPTVMDPRFLSAGAGSATSGRPALRPTSPPGRRQSPRSDGRWNSSGPGHPCGDPGRRVWRQTRQAAGIRARAASPARVASHWGCSSRAGSGRWPRSNIRPKSEPMAA